MFPQAMYLTHQVRSLMNKRGKRVADVCREAPIPAATMSRLLHDKQRFLSDKDFTNLSRVLAQNDNERALLIRARMLDLCQGPGCERIEVVVKGKPEGEALPRVPLSPELRAAFAFLMRTAPQSTNLETALVGLAKLMGMTPQESR